MKLSQIITKRGFEKKSFWDIVYEWEDEMSSLLHTELYYEKPYFKGKYRLCKVPFLGKCFQTTKKAFVFEMSDWRDVQSNNNNNIIPCIIDFFANDSQLQRFCKQFCKNKVVFVTNRQVYDFLKNKKLPFIVEHLALSLPTKYKLELQKQHIKQYDLAIVGRPNPVLVQFLKTYVKKHPGFVYVYNKSVNNKKIYYTSDGICIGSLDSRDDYFSLLQSSRMALYSTTGMDNDRLDDNKNKIATNGYHQVTPRFLEILSCGCHVIPRFQQNSDTDYYELSKYWKSIETYSQFELAVNKALETAPDLNFYSNYLSKHYTSVRAQQLKNILEKYE